MPRNKSERRPFPELSDAAHAYLKYRALHAPHVGDKVSSRIWLDLSIGERLAISGMWHRNRTLFAFYQKQANEA